MAMEIFKLPPHQVMSRGGGDGSAGTNDRWNRFGARFDRYKRAEPIADSLGTFSTIFQELPPRKSSSYITQEGDLVGYCSRRKVFQRVVSS